MNENLRRTVLFAAVLTAGCGQSTPAPGSSTTAAAPPAHDGRPIAIEAGDTIKFNVTEVRATPGERLSLTLVNAGSMPKVSMGHNVVVLAGGTDVVAFLKVAAESPTTDYVPASMSNAVLAHTKLLGPGERDTITFAAPASPGRYEFVCSFPGHYQVGMKGVLIVE